MKHEGKLKTLGGVRGHQRDYRVLFVLIGIRNECGVIDEFPQAFNALFVVIDGRVHEFLQVL